ncbi:MAG: PAS domain S-box protein [Chloroflexota bacterium]
MSHLKRIASTPGFWFILALLVLITVIHYEEDFEQPPLFVRLMSDLGLTRHAFDRILYLAPIVWSGFLFGWVGALACSLVCLGAMLPRVFVLSPSPIDALFETSGVFIIGNVLAISFSTLRKEREYRQRLEISQGELQRSEERYRRLFENAHDTILIQDLEGNILAANVAASKLTGYDVDSLVHMNVRDLLSPDGLEVAREMGRKLLQGETIGESYDQRAIRQDGAEALVRLSSSLIRSNGEPTGFLHIARDVTEEKRLQENLHYYLQQATRAQEEERKRIARELHDDTIQALIVLSRQLDALMSTDKGLSENSRQRVEQLWQQANDIMQGVRRLSQDLRPAALDRLGLVATLEQLAADVSKYSGIETSLKVLGEPRRLSEETELVLFRIAQEALRNVWRHSGATHAEITVQFDEAKMKITVSDNGKGFVVPSAASDLARSGKLGLTGMRERAQLVGANLTVQSEPGKGCNVIVELS